MLPIEPKAAADGGMPALVVTQIMLKAERTGPLTYLILLQPTRVRFSFHSISVLNFLT